MAKFRIGGSGPDGRGLGWIAGLETKRRFDKAGEIYETDVPEEIRALRRCPYVEEIRGNRLEKVDDTKGEKSRRAKG